jgi:hypothetical protein
MRAPEFHIGIKKEALRLFAGILTGCLKRNIFLAIADINLYN